MSSGSKSKNGIQPTIVANVILLSWRDAKKPLTGKRY
jgi:hypothetical protein